MKKASWSLFTYPVMDIKAAEALLNRRAAEGWALDRVCLGAFARFVPADTRWAWCVDWSRPGYSERPDYLALCADAGWALVQKVGAFNLYKAPAGTPPIQTDGGEEARRFRQEVLRANCKGWAVLLVLLLVLAVLALLLESGSWRAALTDALLTHTGLFLLLSLPAMLAAWLLWAGRLLLRLRQWDRAAGGALPVPGRRSAGAAAWLCLLCRLWGAAALVCFLLDAGQRMRTGSAVGLLLGGCLGLWINRRRRSRAGRRAVNGKSVVLFYAAVLGAVLVFPLLSPATNRLLPAPVPAAAETFLPGAIRVDYPTASTGSFGLRLQRWWENPGHDEWDVACYTARWEWLSRLVRELKLESRIPPPEGYPEVWTWKADLGYGTESILLLRSGKTVVLVEAFSDDGISTQQLDRMLSLLSSDQEV